MIRAVLFDFDGTLIDTESPSFQAWREIYAEHGRDLPLERWVERVGTIGGFDPLADLAAAVGDAFDGDSVTARRHARRDELIDVEQLRTGVAEYLEGARRLGLRVGIVTSGPSDWVAFHLERLGQAGRWDCIVCANHDAAVAKPRPSLYLRALDELAIGAEEALAIEDSPNGIAAAKAAGLFCVAAPNSVTAGLDLSRADIVVDSLADLPLSDLLERLR